MWISDIRLIAIILTLFLYTICPAVETSLDDFTADKHYDVIIVLGNPANNDGTPGSIMQTRVSYGIELFRQGLADYILFTGGAVKNQYKEAFVMRSIALNKNIPSERILVEISARNTYENAYYSCSLMTRRGFSSAIIVTSDFHKKRASHIFSLYKIVSIVKACNDSPATSQRALLKWKLRESIILSYHTIFGYNRSFGLSKRISKNIDNTLFKIHVHTENRKGF